MLRLLPVRRFNQEAVMRGPISTVTKAAMALVMATAMLAGACGSSSKTPPPDGGDTGEGAEGPLQLVADMADVDSSTHTHYSTRVLRRSTTEFQPKGKRN